MSEERGRECRGGAAGVRGEGGGVRQADGRGLGRRQEPWERERHRERGRGVAGATLSQYVKVT